MKMRLLLATESLVCALLVAACATGPAAPPSWDDFWLEHGVSPPPPREFLEGWSEPPEIQNLTNGALSDEIVRRWVIGDLRRGAGDTWAMLHLRLDVAKSGVLGPPGLNGTDGGIERELAKGTVEIRCDRPNPVVVAAGVVSVPWKVRQRLRGAHLSEFVVVQAFRSAAGVCKRVLADGKTEVIDSTLPETGELSWQLDVGEFREDPVVGDLWYQARGWSCGADPRGPLYEICRLVQPQ
jgi:hypothetical protein